MVESTSRKIARVVKVVQLGEPNKDAQYWRTLPYSTRLAALEEIREEYHRWKYHAKSGFLRVYSIIKR